MISISKPSQPTAIITDEEKKKAFETIFGKAEVPITSYLPTKVNIEGKGGVDAYMLDFTRVTPEQRSKLVDHLATQFKVDRAKLSTSLEKWGMPILANQCTVGIPGVFFM